MKYNMTQSDYEKEFNTKNPNSKLLKAAFDQVIGDLSQSFQV